MTTARTTTAPLPADFQQRMAEMGLTAVSYRREAVKVAGDRLLSLPRDVIGQDGKTLIIWREADRDYAIDGYCPWHDGMFGGRYTTIGNALAWVQRARDVRAGVASDFWGV